MKINKLAAAAAVFLSSLLAAAPAQAANESGAFVRSHAFDLMDGTLTDSQFATLQLIAHQTAITSVCDGFVLDDAKFKAAFGDLAHASEAEMSDDEKRYFEQHLLVVFGVLIGGELADAARNPGAICDQAEDARADPEMAELLVWQ